MEKDLVLQEAIEGKIFIVRQRRIILDRDLAKLYEVTTGNLNKAVKRNIERFPQPEFMFQLNIQEFRGLIFQNGISKRGGIRTPPYAFTEQGIAMLSSVLKSKRAIQVNIQIMKTFVKLREMLYNHKELWEKIQTLEAKYDHKFRIVFEAIKQLMEVDAKPKRRIGFGANDD